MRYILNTTDEQGIIGAQIEKWKKEGKVEIIEKGEPIVEIKADLERAAKALDTLKKVGYSSAVMFSYLRDQTKLSQKEIRALLNSQDEFFKLIGVIKK